MSDSEFKNHKKQFKRTIIMGFNFILKSFLTFTTIIGFLSLTKNLSGQELKINDLEYFEKQGLNILVFSSEYNGMFFDEKTAGIEIIHHGVRTSTGGAIRLQNTPEQWDLVPKLINRKVDKEKNNISVELSYEELRFNSKISVTAKGKGVEISVYLDKALPKELEGRAGLNIEFLPTAYHESTYLIEGKPGNFPRYPSSNTKIEPISKKITQFSGHTTFDDRGKGEYIVPYALASGKTIVMSPENPEHLIKIESIGADLMLFDGRNVAQNGWFIIRSLLPANKTGKVLTWYLEPNTKANWVRKPVVGFSQVGYTPAQEKVAVIELDKNDTPLNEALVFKVNEDGNFIEKFKGEVKVWGKYLRYNYAKFDFSTIKEEGIYFIQYGNQKTNVFAIGKNVYDNVWHSTMDVWFPVQMDHMQVNEAYRIWHGEPYRDDCLQAPLNHQHFDGYKQGPTTDTKYKPLEHIPGMAVGGWFDAGDFDIQTGSHNSVISSFVELWESFKLDRDQTFIDQETRYVDIHRPDGKPDVLQQIEHGVLNLVAQVENIGHPVRGIIVPNLHQYHHLGDAAQETDNLVYNPNLKPYETDGKTSGTLDDRWAFTNRMSFLDYQTAATLAAASRALEGYNDELAEKCVAYAKKLLVEADEEMKKPKKDEEPWMRFFRKGADVNTTLELYITTKEEKYLKRFEKSILEMLDQPNQGHDFGQMFFLSRTLNPALKAIPYMDSKYKSKLKDHIKNYKELINKLAKDNPYGVPISKSGWGGSGMVANAAITNYYAYKEFPEIIEKEDVLRGINYIFGCHPYSNISFVNAVGTRSKKVAYGNNRADFTTIAGGIVPGLLLLKPDFLENKDDWPFLWGQNEVTIGGSAEYVVLANAVKELIGK